MTDIATAVPACTHTLYGRKINVLSAPRRIAGGYVVRVEWATNEDATGSAILEDGSVHPCHAAGFRWDECTVNIASA